MVRFENAADKPAERSWLTRAHAQDEQRPSILRRFTPPADRFQFHRLGFGPPPSRMSALSERVSHAVDEAEEEVEAGCFRAAAQLASWYLWHRWRA